MRNNSSGAGQDEFKKPQGTPQVKLFLMIIINCVQFWGCLLISYWFIKSIIRVFNVHLISVARL